MSITYSRESGSLFPDSLLNMEKFKDIDDTVKDVILEYYTDISQGRITEAMSLKEAHTELAPYWIDASKLNLLKEEIQNIGIYAQKLRSTVVSSEEPGIDYDEHTLWIKPIE